MSAPTAKRAGSPVAVQAEVDQVRKELAEISAGIDHLMVLRRRQLADERARAAGRPANSVASYLAGK
ncbi:hypothetical protein [Saccharothrix obliqua]|uniref:hypothetical protein n=1 Tax=Saccharothrix obliqua TaxID=2861747 RepID=UPI001C5DD0DE|nr:hypothetical protein [Saccharothrix obliqua]MBW4719639.1 hypothetical protein [Saccharothrix obliqua]